MAPRKKVVAESTPDVEAMEVDDILEGTLDDAEPPEVLPEGMYSGAIEGHEITVTSVQKLPCVNLSIRLGEALKGVDPEELESALRGEPLTGRVMRQMFLLSSKHLWRLKKFANEAGIETSGVPLKEVLALFDNLAVRVQVEQTWTNEETPRAVNNIASIKGA